MAQPEKAASDLEYIRRSMIQSNLSGQNVTTRESQVKKRQEEMHQWIERQNERATQGYEVLLRGIFEFAKEGVVTVSEDIVPVPIEDCFIKEENLRILDDPEAVKKQLAEGKTLQQLYGLSDNVVLTFYELSKRQLEEKKYEEAINAFTFLCIINPDLSPFWVGLGIANEEAQKWPEAIESFEIAIAIDPSNFDSYLALMHACSAIKDYSSAKRALEAALENEAVQEQAKEGLEYIKAQK